jgi:hypothetical protein
MISFTSLHYSTSKGTPKYNPFWKPDFQFPLRFDLKDTLKLNGVSSDFDNSNCPSFGKLFTPVDELNNLSLINDFPVVLGMLRLSYTDRLKVVDLLDIRHLVENVSLKFDFKDETCSRSKDIHNGSFKEAFTYLRTPKSLYFSLYSKEYITELQPAVKLLKGCNHYLGSYTTVKCKNDSPIIKLKDFFRDLIDIILSFKGSQPLVVLYTDDLSYKRLVLGLKASINDYNEFKLNHGTSRLSLFKGKAKLLTISPLSLVFGKHDDLNKPVNSNNELNLQIILLKQISKSLMGLYKLSPSLLTKPIGETSGLLHYTLFNYYSMHPLALKLALLGLEESLRSNNSYLWAKFKNLGQMSFYNYYVKPLIDPDKKSAKSSDLSKKDKILLTQWMEYHFFPSQKAPELDKNYSIPYEYSLLFNLGFKENLIWTNSDYLVPNKEVNKMHIYDVNSLFPFVLSIKPLPQGVPNIITDENLINQIIGNVKNFKDYLKDKNTDKEPGIDLGYRFYGNLKSYLNYLIGDQLGFARVSFIAPPKDIQTKDILPPYAPLGVRGIKRLSLTEIRYFKSLDYQIKVETIFLYKNSLDLSIPITTLGYIKATGQTKDTYKNPDLIKLNKQLAKNLLNAFWGKTLNKGHLPQFEIKNNNIHILKDKVFNPIKVGKNNQIIFIKKLEDLLLQATVPDYKLNNSSYALATYSSIKDYYEAIRILAHGYRDRSHHEFKNFAKSELELNTIKIGLRLYRQFKNAMKDVRLIDNVYLPKDLWPDLNDKDPWLYINNLHNCLLNNTNNLSLPLLIKKDLLKWISKIPKKLKGKLNTFYSPEIGLEALTRSRIYMHLLSTNLRDYNIIKINNDALHLGKPLPSYLISEYNFGWLKIESGPYYDRYLFNNQINAAYYGQRFYYADLPNTTTAYDVIKYHEPLAFNKNVFDTGVSLKNLTPKEVNKLTNKWPFDYMIILKWGAEAQKNRTPLPLIYSYFGLANTYPPIKLPEYGYWYSLHHSDQKTYLEALIDFYCENPNNNLDPVSLIIDNKKEKINKLLWASAKEPVLAYKLIRSLPK